MRFTVAVVSIGVALSVALGVRAGATPIPNTLRIANLAPVCTFASDIGAVHSDSSLTAGDFSAEFDHVLEFDLADGPQAPSSSSSTGSNKATHPAPDPSVPVDANGNPIPLERQEPTRILGFMPNFRTVSGGAKPPPPGWKYNFTVATHQATDYSSFIFLGLTSLSAEGIDEHPALGHGASGFYAYTWRGFLDKTDNTYLSAWLLPSLIHEDTRYYALGTGHNYFVRELYVISRQAVAKTYGGHQTPNIAGLGGKVLTQVVSRYYYPSSATTFPVLAEKFGYSVMRDVIFTSIREFYPDAAAHFIRRHREKMAAKAAAKDATAH
ncbi:MAG: hypothetical protein ACLP07_14120 [Terracidiphilus sp.]